MKYCVRCRHIYTHDILAGQPCPIRDCDGVVIDVDENMLLIIQTLNEQGFCTRNCCSGHPDSALPQTYIQFLGDVNLPCIPTGFKVETRLIEEGEMVTNLFKRHPTTLSSTELQRRLWATARTLLNWAEQLECCEEFE